MSHQRIEQAGDEGNATIAETSNGGRKAEDPHRDLTGQLLPLFEREDRRLVQDL